MPEHTLKLLVTISFQLPKANVSKRGHSECVDCFTPCMVGPQSSPHHLPPPPTYTRTHVPKRRKRPRRRGERAARGSQGGCVEKMSAQMRKVGGGEGAVYNYGRTPGKAGLFTAEGQEGRKNDNPAQSGVCGFAQVLLLSPPSPLSLPTLSNPLLNPTAPRLPRASLFL